MITDCIESVRSELVVSQQDLQHRKYSCIIQELKIDFGTTLVTLIAKAGLAMGLCTFPQCNDFSRTTMVGKQGSGKLLEEKFSTY